MSIFSPDTPKVRGSAIHEDGIMFLLADDGFCRNATYTITCATATISPIAVRNLLDRPSVQNLFSHYGWISLIYIILPVMFSKHPVATVVRYYTFPTKRQMTPRSFMGIQPIMRPYSGPVNTSIPPTKLKYVP